MGILETIAAKISGAEKTMLTCFLANARAIRFYEKLGHTKDEFNPKPKILRNGTKVEVDYVILSKAVVR